MAVLGTIPKISPALLLHFRLLKSLRVKVGIMYDDTLSSFDALWNTLRVENIHLDHIYCSFALPSLFAYIESYKGLKSIAFSQIFDGMATAEDKERFFTSLLMHKDSMEELGIAPIIDSGIREGHGVQVPQGTRRYMGS
ncbi:hypothetical protein BJ165DRAFT_268540 [Panaeolus papilionaceus]|nr:hypothetical protein BJ165DRAFT_268540 [Panaeolus papilionaceus]